MSKIFVDQVDPKTATTLTLGTSGDTITVPTGAGLTVVDEVKTNKISPATGTAFALGDSGDTFTVPSGATIVNSGTATGFGISSSSFLPNAQPIIINGDMAVAQRSTSATGKTVSGYYSVDRVRNEFNVGTYTFAQESLTSGPAYEAGFRNAFRLDTTTAETPTAPDYVTMGYYFEGSQLSSFKFGGPNATKITLAFWVKSNKTGTGNVVMRNPDSSLRQASHSYTISVADTWEHKILVFDGDTSAGFNDDNNQSMQLYWWLDGGSNFQVGSVSDGAWGAQNNSCFYAGADLDIAQNTANDWAFTGVQMLAGEYSASTLPPFQFDSYGDNLKRCQRYYYKLKNDSGGASTCFWGNSMIDSSTTLKGVIRYPEMREKPSSFETTGTATDYIIWSSGNTSTTCSAVPTFESHTSFSGRLLFTVSSGLTAGQAGAYRAASTDAYLAWSAEM